MGVPLVEDELFELGEDMPSDHLCAACNDTLRLCDEIFLLQVVQVYITPEKTHYYPVVNEKGQYSFSPIFLEFDCWEEAEDTLKEFGADIPPAKECAISCEYCGNGIENFETLGLVTLGELHLSRRSPAFSKTEVFKEITSDVQHLCSNCLSTLYHNHLGNWA
jgi:hypothetical protein